MTNSFAENSIPMNGSFRIFVFGGSPKSSTCYPALESFATHSLKPNSYLSAFLRPDAESTSYHELHNPHSRFITFATILAAPHASLYNSSVAGLPKLLARYRDNIFADDKQDFRVPEVKGLGAAHAKMGFKEGQAGVVVVRPDGYVGCVVKLVEGEGTVKALNEYFSAFVGKQLGGEGVKAQL